MSVKIITGFDGACPRGDKGVKRENPKRFILSANLRNGPGLGEEIPGKGSRFSTRLMNDGKTEQAVEIVVDWDTTDRVEHHDIGYVRHESQTEWAMIPGWRDGARVIYRLKLAPGLTHLGLFPEYNVEKLKDLVTELKASGVRVEIAGRSREKRPIWLVQFDSPNPKAKPFLVQARDHAYETAGSYCAEGIARFLASDDPMAQYLLSKFSVSILPMTNPDGVYNGMSQRTWERGPRMDNAFDIPDNALKTVRKVMDSVKPAAFLNIHNWTHKFNDGLLYGLHEPVAESIRRFMPDDIAHYKRWDFRSLSYGKLKAMKLVSMTDYLKRKGDASGLDKPGMVVHTLSELISHWIIYCEEILGGVGIAMEFPWFSRNTADMRDKGRNAFIAMALSIVEDQKL